MASLDNFKRLKKLQCAMHLRHNNSFITRSPSVYLDMVKGTKLSEEEKEAEVGKPNSATEIPFQKLCKSARRPSYATSGSVGMDLFAPHDAIVEPGEQECLPLGVGIRCPPGTYLRLATRSSLGSRAIEVGAGVIDSDYRGEILCIVYNFSAKPIYIREGTAICQGIITPFEKREPIEVNYLEQGARVLGLGRDIKKEAAKLVNLEREFKSLRFNDTVTLFYENEDSEVKNIVQTWDQKLPKFEGPTGSEAEIAGIKASNVLEACVQKEFAEDKLGATSRVIRLHDAVTEHMRPEEANQVWKQLSGSIRELEEARAKGQEIERAIETNKRWDT